MRVKSFRLYNHIIRISYVNKIRGKLLGDCDVNTMKIQVATSNLPDSAIEHNRWHEQVHLMFKLIGKDDLYDDEALVDSMAGMLAQYEASKK